MTDTASPAPRRPLIGITGPDGWFVPGWWFARLGVWLAGGRARRMTPSRHFDPARLDGLIIGGGDDIDPSLYHDIIDDEEEGVAEINPERDAFEQKMIRHALDVGLPLLGICRGAQLINVVLGGSLHRDIRDMRIKTSNKRTPFPSKQASLISRSRMSHLIGATGAPINSLHHQAVDRLGDGLRISGRDADGIVQAIEGTGDKFLIGVQWHPEYLPQYAAQRRLFRHLVAAARQGGAWPG